MINNTRRSLGLVCLSFAALATAAVVGVTSGHGSGHEELQGRRAEQPIVVTRSVGPFEPTCTPQEAGERLRNLTEALRTADAGALEEYWGEGFEWFRVLLAKGGFAAEDFETGLQSLEERGGLRVRFRKVEINRHGGGRFDAKYWTKRSVRKNLDGKFALSCTAPPIVALSSFRSVGEAARCPKPPRSTARNAMIICGPRR